MAHNNNGEQKEEESSALEKIMGALTVSVIFRHFISGAVFVAAFYFAKNKYEAVDKISEHLKENATAIGAAALLTGTLIYSLHRSITNPILEVLRHLVIWITTQKKGRWVRHFIMPSSVERLMFARWEAGKEYRPTPAHISSWGDYVHLQYTTAIALVLGSYVAFHFDTSPTEWKSSSDLVWVAAIFGLSGFYTDCRKHVVELKCYKEKPAADFQI